MAQRVRVASRKVRGQGRGTGAPSKATVVSDSVQSYTFDHLNDETTRSSLRHPDGWRASGNSHGETTSLRCSVAGEAARFSQSLSCGAVQCLCAAVSSLAWYRQLATFPQCAVCLVRCLCFGALFFFSRCVSDVRRGEFRGV